MFNIHALKLAGALEKNFIRGKPHFCWMLYFIFLLAWLCLSNIFPLLHKSCTHGTTYFFVFIYIIEMWKVKYYRTNLSEFEWKNKIILNLVESRSAYCVISVISISPSNGYTIIQLQIMNIVGSKFVQQPRPLRVKEQYISDQWQNNTATSLPTTTVR